MEFNRKKTSYKLFMNFVANSIHNYAYNLLTSSLINCLLSAVQPASQHSQYLAKSQQSIGDFFPIITKRLRLFKNLPGSYIICSSIEATSIFTPQIDGLMYKIYKPTIILHKTANMSK